MLEAAKTWNFQGMSSPSSKTTCLKVKWKQQINRKQFKHYKYFCKEVIIFTWYMFSSSCFIFFISSLFCFFDCEGETEKRLINGKKSFDKKKNLLRNK